MLAGAPTLPYSPPRKLRLSRPPGLTTKHHPVRAVSQGPFLVGKRGVPLGRTSGLLLDDRHEVNDDVCRTANEIDDDSTIDHLRDRWVRIWCLADSEVAVTAITCV